MALEFSSCNMEKISGRRDSRGTAVAAVTVLKVASGSCRVPESGLGRNKKNVGKKMREDSKPRLKQEGCKEPEMRNCRFWSIKESQTAVSP